MEVMLDQFVFRRDGGAKRFPGNATTAAAAAHTRIGDPFGVCVDLARPRPSPASTCSGLAGPSQRLAGTARSWRRTAAASSSGSPLSSRARPLPRISSAPTTTSSTRLSSPAASRLSLAIISAHAAGEEESRKHVKVENMPEVRWVEALLREKHEEQQMALGVDVDQDIEPSSLIPENLGLVGVG
ncbi:hypothetical protein PAHAL_6G300800 [Panicum hallii]|uniref:Uncharacterized protein n=1 Tax=Panicum hallii TaxID=206008 RepID=A0A2T8II73_9POAL|nr:hypothetical protein PAHAL_6G300800 [Panicum hallii]